MNNKNNQQPSYAVAQSYAIIIASGIIGLLIVGFVFRKHLEF